MVERIGEDDRFAISDPGENAEGHDGRTYIRMVIEGRERFVDLETFKEMLREPILRVAQETAEAATHRRNLSVMEHEAVHSRTPNQDEPHSH